MSRASELRRSESDWGVMLETSVLESLYGGQFTLLTQLTKPNYSEIELVAWVDIGEAKAADNGKLQMREN